MLRFLASLRFVSLRFIFTHPREGPDKNRNPNKVNRPDSLDFWERQVQLAGITPSASRIPDYPQPIIVNTPSTYAPPTYAPPTYLTTPVPTPSKRGSRKRRQGRRSDSSSTTTTNQSAAGPSNAWDMPRPYVCPAARPAGPSRDEAPPLQPPSPNVWANLGFPYSEPAVPAVPAGVGVGGSPPLDPRRRFNWPPNIHGRPGDSPGGYQARAWDADVDTSNSWGASATSDWWYPAPLRNGAATPRPTEAQLSPVASPPPPPQPVSGSEPDWARSWARGDASGPPPPGTVYLNSPRDRMQFGDSSRSSLQVLAGGGRGAPGGSVGDSGNQGWLDWVGSYVNTAQTRMLEHFDAPGAAGVGPAPTLPWTPPQMQPLADDPDVRRQIQTHGVPADAPARIRAVMAEAAQVVQAARVRSNLRRDFDVDPLIGRRPQVYPTDSTRRRLFGVETPAPAPAPTPAPAPLVVTSVPL